MALKFPSREDLEIERDDWNLKYPVGTKVTIERYYQDEVKVTRTEARIMIDQKVIIFLEGHNGYFDLCDLTPNELIH